MRITDSELESDLDDTDTSSDADTDHPHNDTGPRHLRLGLVCSGHLIEERLLSPRARVTIGTHPSCTLAIPAAAGLPRRLTLFEHRRGRHELVASAALGGRVALGGRLLALEDLHAEAGTDLRLPLDAQARGKLQLGEVTLLFQLVKAPHAQPRPRLPPSVRGGLISRLDWTLLSSLLALAVLHAGFLVYLRTVEQPRHADPAIAPELSDFLPIPKQPLDLGALAALGQPATTKIEKRTPAAPATPTKRRASSARTPAPAPCDAACRAAKAAAERAALVSRVSRYGVVALLGNKGQGSGAVRDLLRSGSPGAEVDRSLTGPLTTQQRRSGLRARGGSGPVRAVTIDDLADRVDGPREVKTGRVVEEKLPKASVRTSPPKVGGGLKPADVAEIVRRGMPAVTLCYQRGLKRDPRLGGKMVVRLTVSPLGSVSSVDFDVDGLGEEKVTACIQSYAKHWRFPAPEGGAAEVEVPVLFKAATE